MEAGWCDFFDGDLNVGKAAIGDTGGTIGFAE